MNLMDYYKQHPDIIKSFVVYIKTNHSSINPETLLRSPFQQQLGYIIEFLLTKGFYIVATNQDYAVCNIKEGTPFIHIGGVPYPVALYLTKTDANIIKNYYLAIGKCLDLIKIPF